MFAVTIALVSAVSFGISDFTAGLAARASSVLQVTFVSQSASLAVGLLAAPWAGPVRLSAADGWGAAAGVAGMLGAVTLYLGFRHAVFSVASTLSAVGSAALPALAGLLEGERPSALTLAGIAVALPAIAAISAAPGAAAGETVRRPAGRSLAGIGYGLLAGVCFALYFIAMSRAGAGSGLWPVVAGQAAALPVVAAWAALAGVRGLPRGGPLLLSLATGVTGAAGGILYFTASRHGLLAVTAVLTSLYPGGTILLARVRLGERLGTLGLAGLVLAGVSVALIAASSAG